MTPFSYADAFSIEHERGPEEVIHEGDVVRTGPNLHPQFTVVAVSGDKAWLREVQSGADSIGLVERCRVVRRAN
jgi:hypothetical protein